VLVHIPDDGDLRRGLNGVMTSCGRQEAARSLNLLFTIWTKVIASNAVERTRCHCMLQFVVGRKSANSAAAAADDDDDDLSVVLCPPCKLQKYAASERASGYIHISNPTRTTRFAVAAAAAWSAISQRLLRGAACCMCIICITQRHGMKSCSMFVEIGRAHV